MRYGAYVRGHSWWSARRLTLPLRRAMVKQQREDVLRSAAPAWWLGHTHLAHRRVTRSPPGTVNASATLPVVVVVVVLLNVLRCRLTY